MRIRLVIDAPLSSPPALVTLMAEGLTSAGIAARLVLTERTVESHTRSVFMKLNLPATNMHACQ